MPLATFLLSLLLPLLGYGTMVKRPAILRSLRARETFWFYVFASPWILGFLIFYLGPMIASFWLSLTNYSVLLPTRFMGLSNYRAMFEDGLLGISIWNTAYYAALAVPTSMVAGLGLALVLNRGDLRGRSFFRSAFYVPAIMPLVAVSILWIWLLQPRFGLINTLLYFLSIKGPNWLGDPAWSKPGLVIMNLTGVGINMVIFLAALQGVPTHLYEAAELDGRQQIAQVLACDHTDDLAGHLLCGGDRLYQQLPGLHPGLYHDRGRPGRFHALLCALPLPPRVQLFQDGLCLGHGLAVVRCHRRPDLYPVPVELKVGSLWRSIEAWAMPRSGPRPRSASTAPRV